MGSLPEVCVDMCAFLDGKWVWSLGKHTAHLKRNLT